MGQSGVENTEKIKEKSGRFHKSAESGVCEKRRLWTDQELQYLRDASNYMTQRQVAEKLNRSLRAVISACSRHDIKYRIRDYVDGSRRLFWTQSEVTALLGYAETLTIQRAAARLGRSYSSVKKKIDELGISFKHQRLQLNDVADILRVSSRVVSRRREKLGLSFRKIKSPTRSDTRGAKGSDIVAIAKDLLEDPPMRGMERTSAKHLRQVIEEYEGWE